MPITWRNVNGPAPASGVAALMGAASQSLNQGVSQLDNVLQRRQDIQRENVENQVAADTERFRGALEQAQAAGDQNAVNQLMSQYQGRIDPGVLRTAPDEALATVQGRETRNLEFEQLQAADAAAPVLDQIRALQEAGDFARASQLQQENADILSNADSLGIAAADIRQGRERQEDRDETTIQRAADTSIGELLNDISTNPDINSPGEAARAAEAAAQAMGIDPRFTTNVAQDATARWLATNGIDAWQAEALDDDIARIRAEEQANLDAAEFEYQEVVRQNPINERYSFTDETRKDLGDTVQLLTDNGWDTQSGWDTMRTRLRDAEKLFMEQQAEAGNPIPEDEMQDVQALLYMVAEEMGRPGERSIDNNDIKPGVWASALRQKYNEYSLSKENEPRVAAAQQRKIQEQKTIANRITTRAGEARTGYRQSNLAQRELYRNLIPR